MKFIFHNKDTIATSSNIGSNKVLESISSVGKTVLKVPVGIIVAAICMIKCGYDL